MFFKKKPKLTGPAIVAGVVGRIEETIRELNDGLIMTNVEIAGNFTEAGNVMARAEQDVAALEEQIQDVRREADATVAALEYKSRELQATFDKGNTVLNKLRLLVGAETVVAGETLTAKDAVQ